MKVESATVHRSTAALRRVESCAQPLEIGSVAPVDSDLEETSRRELQRMFRLTLDGLGQLLGSDLSEREVDGSQKLAVERVKFRIVRGAVFGTIPPTPIATFRG